jgi:hypothetical protein
VVEVREASYRRRAGKLVVKRSSTDGPLWSGSRCWFVYVFALTDCSGFKVGFSCNPLQRIYCFHRRYYERFDLHESALLQVSNEADARRTEAALKARLAAARIECPPWVPLHAGGHTEWFGAVQLSDAHRDLRSASNAHEDARVLDAFEVMRAELSSMVDKFEPWAWNQGHLIHDVRTYRDDLSVDAARCLRDWLDAYRYFGIELFVEDTAAREFVLAMAMPRSHAASLR